MTTTLTPDILILCAAIDAGDDSLLPALTDVLKRAGDSRATPLAMLGVLRIRQHSDRALPVRSPRQVGDVWVWRRFGHTFDNVVESIFWRLEGWIPGYGNTQLERAYPTRSAAFLALAEALES